MIGASGTTTMDIVGVEGVPLTTVGMGVKGPPKILKTRFNTHPCRITSMSGGCVCTMCKDVCSYENESTWITSSYNHGKLDINSTNTRDFLDFTEAKSRSKSCKMTIYLLYFLPMIRWVRMY
jgi:hypothetical protein